MDNSHSHIFSRGGALGLGSGEATRFPMSPCSTLYMKHKHTPLDDCSALQNLRLEPSRPTPLTADGYKGHRSSSEKACRIQRERPISRRMYQRPSKLAQHQDVTSGLIDVGIPALL